MKREQFRMTSVKLKKKGAVVTWEENGKEMSSNNKKEKAHPDLEQALQKLVPLFKEIFHINGNENAVEATGVTLFDVKESKRCIISAKFETDTLQWVVFPSGQIELDGEDYEAQKTLKEDLEVIIDEAYAYQFKNKHGDQQDIDFPETEEKE
jgi:thiamine phosphate synthase YjbQ (UPF0047 family)